MCFAGRAEFTKVEFKLSTDTKELIHIHEISGDELRSRCLHSEEFYPRRDACIDNCMHRLRDVCTDYDDQIRYAVIGGGLIGLVYGIVTCANNKCLSHK